VLVGGSDLETAVHAFESAGFEARRAQEVDPPAARDVMLALEGDAPEALRQADRLGLRYVLVHVGRDDGVRGGTYDRAHHRVRPDDLPQLAARLRSREGMLVSCLAFGYKQGLPASADWVVDTRFLDNPYWVEELREQSGLDEPVRQHVLRQPAAERLIDDLSRLLRDLVPLYRYQNRSELTLAFGCTGGRHRSVVVGRELARRLEGLEGVDVEFLARDL
jgi:RNase adapter protein RapZ